MGRVGESWKPAGALHLDPVGKDADADMVTGEAVGAVDHGIDQSLQPYIVG
ncbi:hypothetical protein ACFFX0_14630 [Citricoccus parietis]|uniref:Uncharacterized protein n=1 Tax=Citricoccus parietis TaxID=592307 RepID=A0ABV5G0B5_9MICC